MGFVLMRGGRSLDDMATNDTLVDPAIGGEHGFVSVTRITGRGQVLLLVPENGTDFQAWRDTSGNGKFELSSLSKAYVENEGANASTRQWVAPTGLSL
eukprot:SAG22_NODE_17584_length_302_cov_0.960591_1_plen_97_part_01